jgi:hypothetical protein
MNKKTLLFFITASLAMLLQPNIVSAEETPKALYCPEKIECSKDKSISSCKATGEHLEYWSKVSASGTVKKGTYFLNSIYSYYQYPFTMYSSGCSYSTTDYYPAPTLYVNTPTEYNIKLIQWEAAKNDTSKWQIYGYQAQCNDYNVQLDPKTCPLEPVPLVKVIVPATYWNISKISAYANGVLLNDEYFSQDNQFNWKSINMYQAWDSCSDTGLCTIELMATINQVLVDVGSIVVDMDNKMKITHVHAITGFEITHDEKLNSIEIKPVS